VPETKVDSKKRREQFMLYAPLVIWIGVIFFLSSGQGASTRTSLIIRPLLEFLFPAALPETIDLYHGIIRKLAHFTEYAVLAILALRAFTKSSAYVLSHFRYLIVVLVVLLISSLDEFNQSFELSRTSSVWDVALDILGGICALAIIYFAERYKHRPFFATPTDV
jgi:VanZ family protein